MSESTAIHNEFPVAVNAGPNKRCCGEQRQLPNKRKDFFAANAPDMPNWWLARYAERVTGSTSSCYEPMLFDAEIQWRWEFAEKMIKQERLRK